MSMIEIIKTRDNKKVIEAMIEGRQSSVWSFIKSEKPVLDFNKGVYVKHPDSDFKIPLIATETYMNTIFDIDDDFAQEVNEILYSLEKDNSEKVIEILKEKYEGDIVDDGYWCFSGYTYNNPDDCYLDRDIVYDIFEYDGDSYAFIQVHYGADARVGFGAMVCFKVKDIEYFFTAMEITAYDSEKDEEIPMYELDDLANYDIESNTWYHKVTGSEIYLHSSAEGY